MKNISKYLIALSAVVALSSCTHDFPEKSAPSSGSADFTKMVSVGNSIASGYMNGALYTDGQKASFPLLIAQQMQHVGGGVFNQPDINSKHGYSGAVGPVILGRLRLVGRIPTPFTSGEIPTPYAGDKSALNNFGVPGATLFTAQTPATGGPGTPMNPAYNPLYARFASKPSLDGITGSTIIGDAAAALKDGGTFFIFWLGSNDVLGYATGGASNPDILTSNADFDSRLKTALNTMLDANPIAKGVVANIPNIYDTPYFTAVPYNSIAFDSSKPTDVAAVNLLNSLAMRFNAALDGIVLAAGHAKSDADIRKVSYDLNSANPILIYDEDLEDLSPKFDMLLGAGLISAVERALLEPYVQARPATSNDLVVLTAVLTLGRADPMDPNKVWGVSAPMKDRDIITENELEELSASVATFNSSIASLVQANSDRLVLVDINAIFSSLVKNGASINGSVFDASFLPPFGAFSIDGIHPNSRGYAYLANKFIETINDKFNSEIPTLNPNDYPGNDLPE